MILRGLFRYLYPKNIVPFKVIKILRKIIERLELWHTKTSKQLS